MALPSYAKNAKTPAEHHEVYLDLIGSSQGRGIPSSMMAAMKSHAQLVKALPAKDHSMLHKKISAHVNQLLRDDEISDDEASTVKSLYAPATTKQAMRSEETTQIDELSVIKKLNYIDAAEKNSDKLKAKMAFHYNRFNKEKGDELHNKLLSRDAGITRADKSIEKKTGISSVKMGKLNKLRFAITREEVEESKFKEGKDMELDEKKMTDAEMAKREKIVKSMKKGFKGFKQRYGERAKEVMYATATKQAMKEGAEEEQPPPGQHFCAKHVLSNVFGEGVVLDGQHAEPDENGHVEWYTVQFDHGEEVIFAEDVEIMMAEFHNNHSPSKKKMKKKE